MWLRARSRRRARCNSCSFPTLVSVALIGLGYSSIAAPQAVEKGTETSIARLSATTLAARGRQESLLSVPRLGRYAILAKSPQGTSLQIIDRRAGPGPVEGAAGERDGRIDQILEGGEYKIVARSHEQGRGEVQLSLHPFVEKNASPTKLVELKPVSATLNDFEQYSYWLDLGERRSVWIEAAGRHLTDLKLWKEGTWVVDVNPESETVAPQVGRPLRVLRLAATLDSGLYLLTAYGGPPLPWAEDDNTHPLYIRWGIPRLGAAGRQRMVASPFGTDRFLVPHTPNFFRIELPEAREAVLRVGAHDPEHPFRNSGETAEVDKKTVPPIAEVRVTSGSNADWIVSVTAGAGQPYVLQHFDWQSAYTFQGQGDHWISSVHSGHPEDSVDATAIVTAWQRGVGERHITPILKQAIPLDAKTGWARRCNLLDRLTVFFEVQHTGTYEILAKGTDALFRFEPFMTSLPERYQAPDPRGSGSTWDLDAGLWVLTADPKKKGILDVVVRPKGLLAYVLDSMGFDRQTKARPVQAAVRFPRVSLDPLHNYSVFLNLQPEVRAGLIVRSLPLDLGDPLFISQAPDEIVQTSFRASESGAVLAEAEDGDLLELSVDDGVWQKRPTVAPGPHTIAVRHARKLTTSSCLRFVPSSLDSSAPLPPLPDASLAALPAFPTLTESQPVRLDLERSSSASYLVRAERSAIYRLASTGLLATSGNLRSRTITSLARGSQNGVGRNFSVLEYLNAGLYQTTVATEGKSAGHLGLELSRSDPSAGGFLTLGAPARVSLAEGQSVEYRIRITKPGRFRLRALALDRTLRCRLEDTEGWPLYKPGIEADLTHDFAPGQYRLIVLPETTPMRVITRIDPMERVRRLKGHGPHRLPLARRIDYVWNEPKAGGERVPDVWQFVVPAPIEARIELSGGMQGDLYLQRENDALDLAASVPVSSGFNGTLAQGRYVLKVVAARPNNLAPYAVAVWPEQLVAGLDREVTAPAEIPVSIGATSLTEISSFGRADVRARLFDAAGRLVALSDDRPDDWNFAISRVLDAGRYRLRVAPVGASSGSCTVSLRVPREIQHEPLALPVVKRVAAGRNVHVYPLRVSAQPELLWISAQSQESIGVSVDRIENGRARMLGTSMGRSSRLEIPLPTDESSGSTGVSYRLRLWSIDRRDSSVRLAADTASPAQVSEASLSKGVRLASEAQNDAPSLIGVKLDRPGVFTLVGKSEDLRFCDTALAPCRPATRGLFSTIGPRLFVIGEKARTVSARRFVLGSKNPLQIPVEPDRAVTVDLEKAGALIVRAHARLGQPGVVIDDRNGAHPPVDARIAVDERAALSVSLAPDRPVARLWAASSSENAFEARLSAQSFLTCDTSPIDNDRREGALERGACHAFDLPQGDKRLRLTLDTGLVAVVSRGREIEGVFWSDTAALAETIESSADRLSFFSMQASPARYAAHLIRLSPGERSHRIDIATPYEASFVSGGALRLNVAATDSNGMRTLHVRGARRSPVFVSSQGLVRRGSDIALGADSGVLELPHGVEPVLAWIDRPGEESRSLWTVAREAREIDLSPPSLMALEGVALMTRLKLKEPAIVHLRTSAPVVTYVERGEALPEVNAHPRGASLDAFLPAGSSRLGLRAFGARTMHGEAEVTLSAASSIGEGLGPETLLGPGESRLYSFTVERESDVGFGVRASADVADALLMDASGKPLGSGSVQMTKLKPGAYFLAIKAPAEGPPVTVRPAIAGLKTPDTGPPDDVIRQYVGGEDVSPAFTAQYNVEEEAASPECCGSEEEGVSEEADSEEGESEEESTDPEESESGDEVSSTGGDQ